MEIREIFRTTLEIVVEFKELASEVIGAGSLLDDYVESLNSGLSRVNDLGTDQQEDLLEEARQILDIIADETRDSPLKAAIIRRLRREIGLAIKRLDD